MAIFISKQLKYFMVAMEHKSITKAAETLFITRTPLSKILADLEKFIGDKLFIRQYNTLEPTQLALELYYDLLPIYEAHQKIERKIKRNDRVKNVKLIFDVSFPEVLYRLVVSIFNANNEQSNVMCEKETITDQFLEANKHNSDVIIISLRKLSPVVHYNYLSWEGSELTLIKTKGENNKIPKLKVFLWKDMFSCFFEEKIMERLGGNFSDVEIIKHNYDFSTLIYKVHQGHGAVIMPEKISCIYKTESIERIPLNGWHLKVNIYHNLSEKCMPTLHSIKNTLGQLL